MIRKLWPALLALVVLSGCTSTQRSVNALSPTADPATAVARITYRNGTVETIGQDEFELFRTRTEQFAQQELPPNIGLDLLVSRKLMLYLARTTDTIASPQDIESVITNVTQGPFCNEAVPRGTQDNRTYLDQCAQAYGFQNGADFRNFVAEELTISDVSAAEAPKDLIRTAHILTPDYEQAAVAYDRVQGSPSRFADVAREVSIDPGSRDDGGELPPFNEEGFTDAPPGQQPQQFNTAFVSNTWALRDEFEQTGEAITEPFFAETEAYSGYHIVKLLGLEASQNSANNFRQAVLERALSAEPSELGEADTGDVPLVGVVEVLADFAAQEPPPSLPPLPMPEETATPSDDDPVLPAATPEGDQAAPSDAAEPSSSGMVDVLASPAATTTP